jgi:hypothetical protein
MENTLAYQNIGDYMYDAAKRLFRHTFDFLK